MQNVLAESTGVAQEMNAPTQSAVWAHRFGLAVSVAGAALALCVFAGCGEMGQDAAHQRPGSSAHVGEYALDLPALAESFATDAARRLKGGGLTPEQLQTAGQVVETKKAHLLSFSKYDPRLLLKADGNFEIFGFPWTAPGIAVDRGVWHVVEGSGILQLDAKSEPGAGALNTASSALLLPIHVGREYLVRGDMFGSSGGDNATLRFVKR